MLSPLGRIHSSLAASSSSSFDDLIDTDIIVFQRKEQETATENSSNAVIKNELGTMQEDGRVALLSAWTDEYAYDSSIEFVVAEEDGFPGLGKEDISKIISVIDERHVDYGSRQVAGGKGPKNPHGQEAELVYYVDQEALENVDWCIKPELEILW